MIPFLKIVQVVGTVVGHVAKTRKQAESVQKPETPEELITPPCLKGKKNHKPHKKR